jgi:hypothetical protein
LITTLAASWTFIDSHLQEIPYHLKTIWPQLKNQSLATRFLDQDHIMSASGRPDELWRTTPVGSARMAALGDRILRYAREDEQKALSYLVGLANAETTDSGANANGSGDRKQGDRGNAANGHIPSPEEIDRLLDRCELFRRLERVPASSPEHLPRLPIGMFSPGEIKSKVEYVARLCILDNHGRLPEPVGLIEMM